MTAEAFKDAVVYCIIACELESRCVFEDDDERMEKIESLTDKEQEKLYWSITESALRNGNFWQTMEK